MAGRKEVRIGLTMLGGKYIVCAVLYMEINDV
jgi:hypothetical protein